MRGALTRTIMIVALGACARGPSRAMPAAIDLPRDFVGCYELHRTQKLYYAPPRLRLTADTLSRRDRGLVMDSTAAVWALMRLDAAGRPMEVADPGALFWRWNRTAGRLQVVISSGYSGTDLLLRVSASRDTLKGSATEHWDFGPPFSNAAGSASLVRVPCLSEPNRM